MMPRFLFLHHIPWIYLNNIAIESFLFNKGHVEEIDKSDLELTGAGQFCRFEEKMKGFWFYGMAGAGKTTGAEHLASLQHNSFFIDGDVVRRYISTDLEYTEADREIQIGRILGISLLAMDNQMVPKLLNGFHE